MPSVCPYGGRKGEWGLFVQASLDKDISIFAAIARDAKYEYCIAAVAQLVERVLGKDEVMGSNPISS